jgi:UPF0271 protein
MQIDLNCDLGEGFGRWSLGDDAALVDVVSSANVACGFHAGDPGTMRQVAEWCVDAGVAIGAQVGYRDLAGFGRRFIDVEPSHLADEVLYQIGALDAFARRAGARVTYVKPHGALYNAIVHHQRQAEAVVEGVRAFDATMPVLGLPGSLWLELAEKAGLRPVAEAFADRAYTREGTLVPRSEPGAVLHDAEQIAERCVRLATSHEVVSVDGTVVPMTPDSICVHGDTAGAAVIARAVRDALEAAGLRVAAFSGAG